MCTFRMQHEAITLNSTTVEEEFNVTANDTEADIQRLCRIVTYFFFVEAIDNDSNIYYYMKQNALDALAYWVSFTSYTLLLFGHFQLQILKLKIETERTFDSGYELTN